MKNSQSSMFMTKARMYPGQFTVLLTMALICANLFVTPTAYVQSAGRAVWLMALLSYLAGLLLILVGWGLARQFPDECLPEYVPRLLGNVLGRAYLTLMALVLIVNAAEDIRNSLLSGTAGLLVYTPAWAIAAVLVTLSAYLAWTGHIRFARGSYFYGILVALTFVATLVLTRRWMQFGYLKPWLDFSEWKPATLYFWAGVTTFRAGVVVALLYPYVHQQSKILPYSIGALTIATVAVAAATLASIAVLGLNGALHTTRPYTYILTTIFFADAPFETFDFLARLLLLNNSIFTVAIMLWSAGHILRQSFWKQSTDGPFILGAGAIAFLLQFTVSKTVSSELISSWVIILVYTSGLTLAPLIPLAMWKNARGGKGSANGGPRGKGGGQQVPATNANH